MADIDNLEIQLTFQNRAYRLRPKDFTGTDDLEVYKATGVSITDVFLGQISLFTIAALIWRYRVNNGEAKLTYREVNDAMDFSVLETVSDDPDTTAEDLAPEA